MPYLQLKMFREKSFLAYLAALGRREIQLQCILRNMQHEQHDADRFIAWHMPPNEVQDFLVSFECIVERLEINTGYLTSNSPTTVFSLHKFTSLPKIIIIINNISQPWIMQASHISTLFVQSTFEYASNAYIHSLCSTSNYDKYVRLFNRSLRVVLGFDKFTSDSHILSLYSLYHNFWCATI